MSKSDISAPRDYAALDDAAARALWMLMLRKDQSKEHMGALYKSADAGIGATDTITTDSKTGVSGTLSLPGLLLALFHNHPRMTTRASRETSRRRDNVQDQFSKDDQSQARRLRVPSYISAGHKVMRYDPNTDRVQEVLAEFPIEAIRSQYITGGDDMTQFLLQLKKVLESAHGSSK